ncbi:hypothetical protein [Mycolicibacterium komossense]|uniref:Uncharacterized protein n=1 Tax=Mycolicibacterium komossense TaxID=1779 RepID=A0ABT3C5A5_9MYCO|nr:hypothetical protein [Mycolicibacterium komossense]MCV7224642.1 hypothetical protein [Mycolicibacterium komossense]
MNRLGRIFGGAVLSGGVAVAVTLGISASTAQADTTTQAAAPADAAAPQNADQLLAVIGQEYDTGAGGGQVSNLIHAVLQLRAQGFKPSPANAAALSDALSYRPNQVPLINALKSTLAYQQKQQSRAQPPSSGGGYTIGINQYDPSNPSVLGGFGVSGPNGGIGIGGG